MSSSLVDHGFSSALWWHIAWCFANRNHSVWMNEEVNNWKNNKEERKGGNYQHIDVYVAMY